MCASSVVLVWRSEDNLEEFTLFFHHIGPRNWTQIVRLGSKYLDLLSCHHSPLYLHFSLNSLLKDDIIFSFPLFQYIFHVRTTKMLSKMHTQVGQFPASNLSMIPLCPQQLVLILVCIKITWDLDLKKSVRSSPFWI